VWRSDTLAAVGSSIEQIETKIAYLEQASAELSDVVYQQRQEIESLRTQLAELLRRLDAAQTPVISAPQDEKPPHY
jgi:SlyX protein